jgi:DnaJ-class molecular chaperone
VSNPNPNATQGADLYVKQKITLKEALCGWSSYLVHMDGRVLHLQTQPGDVIRPGPSKVIPGIYSCDRGTACKARTARERLQQRKRERDGKLMWDSGEGMPIYRRAPRKGRLFLDFEIEFPAPVCARGLTESRLFRNLS